jgi:NADPH:quinone reductase-like Zn-dependent oxidoreductase
MPVRPGDRDSPLRGSDRLACALRRAPLEPDDRVLIQGTGGVALFALQFAHAAGVRCIVLSSSDDKLKRARKLGASDLINYRDTPDWHLAVQEITQGEGATHILELGAEDTYERSLQCLAPNGTASTLGRPFCRLAV